MLKILFVLNHLYPNMDANSEIAYRIADVLHKKNDCDITVLGFDDVCINKSEVSPYGFKTITIDTLIDYYETVKSTPNKIYRLIKFARHPRTLRLYLNLRKMNSNSAMKIEYQHAIHKEVRLVEYDCIIAISEPFFAVQALLKINPKIPYIVYKLDPNPSEMPLIYHRVSDAIIKDEKKVNQLASAIIVPQLIYSTYVEKAAQKDRNKIFSCEFPNVVFQKEAQINIKKWDKKCIHCVFSGRLYKNIRNSQYAISIFEILEKENIVFHIFGHRAEDLVIPDMLPSNVICHGRVSSEEALAYMQAADVLVNIGNSVMNMLPSKILTYISLGKPILNIIKNPACPTLPYTEKYPLALNVLETSEVQQDDIKRVREFLLDARGKRIPFADIEKLYETCTPEYVGKQVYDIICKVVDEKKGNK